MTDAPIIPTKTVRFPILVVWAPGIGAMWHATSLLTGATFIADRSHSAFAGVCALVRRQFEAEGVSRKQWAAKLDEAPECAFRDWVVADFWGGSDNVQARVLELAM